MILCLLVTLVVFQSSPISAQSEASVAFTQGQEHFEKGDYEVALKRFQESHRLVPHANTLFNVGICLERLKRFTAAFQTYHTIVRDPRSADEARKRATELRDALSDRVSLVSLASEDVGIEARLSSEEGFRVLPDQWAVEPGAVRFEMRLDGKTWEEKVDATFGNVVHVQVNAPVERTETPEAIGPLKRPASDALSLSPKEEESRPTFQAGPLTWVGLTTVGLGTALGIGSWVVGGNVFDQHIANGRVCMMSVCDDGQLTNIMTWTGVGIAIVGGILMLIDLLAVSH